jgi:glutamate-1-semialdehyde 2,1-aminomutase
MIEQKRSARLFAEAQRYLPGGVDSPVRAFKKVGGTPPFIVKGQGSRIYDADGNEYIDYVCSWGPMILGHSHPQVVAALQKAVTMGTSFGAPTELETTLAKLINKAMPSMEMLRFVNSGTEATMSALRLARAFTKRDKIIKFSGGYHGHSDGLLVKGGSGLATLGIADTPGVPESHVRDTLVARYNSAADVEKLLRLYQGQIAAVIVEPVAANMGVVAPQPDFLPGLRELTRKHGALLVFDEVITGFRLSYGGAQEVFGVKPDLTCLGKIIGGGLPVGAYGGRREIMEMMAPSGPVYQAGTLSGNPIAMTAGIETLRTLSRPGTYEELEVKSKRLQHGLVAALKDAGPSARINRVASLMTVFFTGSEVTDYESASTSDTACFAKVHRGLLAEGIYWPPAQFEALFVSLAHSEDDIDLTIRAFRKAVAIVSN